MRHGAAADPHRGPVSASSHTVRVAHAPHYYIHELHPMHSIPHTGTTDDHCAQRSASLHSNRKDIHKCTKTHGTGVDLTASLAQQSSALCKPAQKAGMGRPFGPAFPASLWRCTMHCHLVLLSSPYGLVCRQGVRPPAWPRPPRRRYSTEDYGTTHQWGAKKVGRQRHA